MRNLFTSILAFSLVLSFISSAQCQTQSEKLSDATWILVNSYKNNIQNSGIEKNSWFTPGRKDDKYYVTFSFEFFKNQD
ncbi:MAG: hypothetical protein ABIV51_10515, partial [Saprospiraceae bacterium]